ncbi:PilW family protein [Legionella spiritensis]|uniref:Type IV fimbrial biogenesis PilW-like protein n=1 Tax=Legionella spiritensis TaxID=452 RepID=A0A0W0YW67_LEGSP|nr:PilW family protein [Legionella spiritensis]KTD61121.1 type IV fimbrial biogenesis PilW-like protein [Legionella spiritensis]SNV45029.1 type IV pilus assembly protein PilW [Legionella spiritensis]VEG90897.1 type IV pilus assembly protein PilW [Legionella spiritensis]
MNRQGYRDRGFSIVEMMVGTFVGLLLSLAIVLIYVSQSRLYKTSNSQAGMQSAKNAIANLLTPVVRSAGFMGCGSFTTVLSNLNAGGSPPLGTINTSQATIAGYDGGTSSIAITQHNASNSTSASNWTPSLDASLVGNVQRFNDVLVVLGASYGDLPVGVTAISPGSSTFTIQGTNGMTITSGGYGAISDCLKTSVFKITGVTGTTIDHSAGGGTMNNASSSFAVNFPVGSQFVPLRQTAFFVGQGPGGESALMRATLSGTTWTVEPMIPGVQLMKIQYGIGSNGIVTRYVPASSVTSWAQVYSIRIGFILQGKPLSGSDDDTNPTQYNVLNIPVTVPADNRLRHVFEMTIHLRNAIS